MIDQELLNRLWQTCKIVRIEPSVGVAREIEGLSARSVYESETVQTMVVHLADQRTRLGDGEPLTYVRKRGAADKAWEEWLSCSGDD